MTTNEPNAPGGAFDREQDAALAACLAASAATAAHRAAAEADAAEDDLGSFLERERAELLRVAATRARTSAGIAAKAALLDAFARATAGCEPPPASALLLSVLLLFSIAQDATDLAKVIAADAAGFAERLGEG